MVLSVHILSFKESRRLITYEERMIYNFAKFFLDLFPQYAQTLGMLNWTSLTAVAKNYIVYYGLFKSLCLLKKIYSWRHQPKWYITDGVWKWSSCLQMSKNTARFGDHRHIHIRITEKQDLLWDMCRDQRFFH